MSNGKINGANMLASGKHAKVSAVTFFVRPTVQGSKVKFVNTVPFQYEGQIINNVNYKTIGANMLTLNKHAKVSMVTFSPPN